MARIFDAYRLERITRIFEAGEGASSRRSGIVAPLEGSRTTFRGSPRVS